MHVIDGVLSQEVIAASTVLAAAGTAVGLKQAGGEKLPRVALLGAVFFVAALVHMPVGPSSVHFILNGLIGLILGWAVFPAMLVALMLESVFFGFGGLTVIGVNVLNIALPAVAVHYAFRGGVMAENPVVAGVSAFAAGSLALILTAALVSIDLTLSGEGLVAAARMVFVTHLPLMVAEGFLAVVAVSALRRVKPAALTGAVGQG